MNEVDQYRFNDIVITPYLTPKYAVIYPSLIGYNSLMINYTNHYIGNEIASLNCGYVRPAAVHKSTAIFCGVFMTSYGHFIYESLSMLYFIKSQKLTCPLVYSYTGNDTLNSHQRQILNILELDNDILFINKPTLFKDIYIPPPGNSLGGFFTKDQLDALGIIACNPVPGKKIYMSRKNIKTHGIINEEEIEGILRPRGWEIIYPEELPVKTQLNIYASAEIIFTTAGSALHSILFLKNPTQRFIVIPRVKFPAYNLISTVKCTDYHLLNVPMKKINNKWGAEALYKVDITEIERIVRITNDFTDLSAASTTISLPPRFNNPHEYPKNFFERCGKPSLENKLFYRILYALKFKTAIKPAIKCLKLLIKKRILKDYMYEKCLQFAKLYVGNNFSTFIKACYGSKFNNDDIPDDDKKVTYNELKDYLLSSFDLKQELIKYLNRLLGRPILFYHCHLSNIGWIEDSVENNINGYCNGENRIEAVRCFFNPPRKTVSYTVLTRRGDWLSGKDGEIVGTTGKSVPITAIKFTLEDGDKHHICYRAYIEGRGWSDWARNGEIIYFKESVATAIQIKLVHCDM